MKTVKISLYETDLTVEGNYTSAESASEIIPGCSEDFEVTDVFTASGDNITALIDGISDRYAAFLAKNQRRQVDVWTTIADAALEAHKEQQAENKPSFRDAMDGIIRGL